MHQLIFGGFVTHGIGKHVELGVPGRGLLSGSPPDWPEVLCPGSLNVRIDVYPPELVRRGLQKRTTELDKALFVPAFEIPRDLFTNNRLSPRPGVPRGGDAQVWRAAIMVIETGLRLRCWALRRFGSRLVDQLEFVAADRLRDSGLQDNQRVSAILEGRWRDA